MTIYIIYYGPYYKHFRYNICRILELSNSAECDTLVQSPIKNWKFNSKETFLKCTHGVTYSVYGYGAINNRPFVARIRSSARSYFFSLTPLSLLLFLVYNSD
jgi:hypothetical protein